jgi:PAS domain S-box-containing protein
MYQAVNRMMRPSSLDQIPAVSLELNAAFTGFDSMDVCMMGLMPDGKIAYINQSTCDMLGYSKEELLSVSIQTVAPGMTTEPWSSFWSEVDRKGTFENQTPLMLRLSNQEDLQVRYRAIRVQAAAHKGCVIFLSKPEKIPTAVVDVQANRAQFVQILDAMTNPVISMDAQHKFTFLNKAACHTFGTTVAKATGKTVYDYLPKKYADVVWEKEQGVLDSGRPCTYVADRILQAKYGESVSLLPFFDPSSNQKRILAVINKASESAVLPTDIPQPSDLLQNPQKPHFISELRRYMDEGTIGIFLKDTDNRILWVNRSYAAILGFEPKDLIGKRVGDVINDPQLLANLRKEDEYVYATGRSLFNLLKQPDPNEKKWIRMDKLPFIDRNKKIAGIIGLAVEIDEPPAGIRDLQEKLSSTSRKLEDTETALRVLLEHREKDVSLTKDKLADKIKTLVLPYLESIKQTKLQQDQLEYIDLIEENFKNFYDPNYAKLAAPEYKLSPTELKVAQLVRDGKTNKEIAKMLHLSKSTILTHRHHIRVKLGIKNKKVNLRSLLSS